VGTHFHGWQRQANAPRTVQAVLEKSLAALCGAPAPAHAAGRTDAGVHADGQVVHFDLDRPRDPARVREALNAQLPWDVRVKEVGSAPADFHARRDAVWEEYSYRWSRAAVVAPKDSLFVSPLSLRADAARMRAAARHLPGERDFRVFGVRLPRADPGVRRLRFVGIAEEGEEIRAVFRGDAFLRGMVRSLCGVLADVGRGKVAPERVRELLETGDRRLLSPKAPACGLSLVRVHYSAERTGS